MKQTAVYDIFRNLFIRKGLLKIIACSLFFLPAPSFSQSWEWAISGGGIKTDKGTDIAIDAAGNTYVTGYYNNEGAFGSLYLPDVGGESSNKEVFIAKIDPDGNFLWIKSGNSYLDNRGLGICLDPSGNVYVTGMFWGLVTFGPLTTINTTGYTDQIFLVKLDNDGNFIWLVNAGCEYGDDHGQDLISDKQGNIYVTGFVSCRMCSVPDSAQFGTHTFPLDVQDSASFIAKISPSGVWQWVKPFQGIDLYRDSKIAVDSFNNVYVTGGFWGTKRFGNNLLTSKGGTDIFVVKYDSNGNYQFVRSTGSALNDRGNGITVDFFNDVYITGEFRDKVPFGDDTLNNNGGPNGKDIFVAKMRANGDWVWAKKAGSNAGSDRGNGIIANKKGNVFVTGQFRDTAKFGGNITLSSIGDSVQIFVAAIDTTGKWKWALQAGGRDIERGNSITCDDSCNLYVIGFYDTDATFGTHAISALGGKDIFVAKVENACFDYKTNPPIPPPSPECTVIVPNVFTPNGDGTNDKLFVIGDCIQKMNFVIYNRWGMEVFETSNTTQGWDGTSNGQKVSVGVYYYVLNADLANGTIIHYKGFISML